MLAMAGRETVPFKITVSKEAERAIRRVAAQRNMSIKGLWSALGEWFADLDETYQAVVLGHIKAGDGPSLVEIVLRRSDPAIAELFAQAAAKALQQTSASRKPRPPSSSAG